jgi:rhomboid protease GluP
LSDSAHLQPTATVEGPPEGLVEAGIYATYDAAFQHSLVILAMDEPCWLVPAGEAHRLMIESKTYEAARDQLARFDRESAGWPPAPIIDSAQAGAFDVITPLLWSAMVLAVFQQQLRHGEWVSSGALDPQAIFDWGEVWRVLTALFLHASAAHVIANALGGILAFTAWLSTAGKARGWLLLLAASLAGNLAVAGANYGRDYRSVGASTAIFAALGLLTGRATRVVLQAVGQRRWRPLFIPLATGLVVLGLYGAGGARVDVPAHLTGFAAGLVLGFFYGRARV